MIGHIFIATKKVKLETYCEIKVAIIKIIIIIIFIKSNKVIKGFR